MHCTWSIQFTTLVWIVLIFFKFDSIIIVSLIHIIIIFIKWIGWGLSRCSKTNCESPTISDYKSTTIKASWSACRAASSKDRWIEAYSIGLTIPRKLGSTNTNTSMLVLHFLCSLWMWPIILECYITLGWKGLPGTNILAYWANS
jgi:hypothetical protein